MSRFVRHQASEPARALIAAYMRAASQLTPMPGWFRHHPLQLTSPAARQVLWALGRRLTGRPDVGFAMAERVPEDALGSLWRLYEVAPSLRALTEAYDSFSGLLLDFMSLRVVVEGGYAWVSSRPYEGTALDRGEQDFRTAMLLKTWRRLTRLPQLLPLAVDYTYGRPVSVRAHHTTLGSCTLRFARPELRIALAQDVFDGRLPGADSRRFAALVAEARTLADTPTGGSLVQRVEALITEQLVRGTSAARIARALGLSERSLRRRLSEEGASYRAVLSQARLREGDLLLEAAGLPLEQVARLLGFANGGALRNAMPRWSLLGPSARRRSLQTVASCATRSERAGEP